jgi:class 3 adenylate cyclase/tetratricopeptide (TPR) repeat protein
MGDPTPKSSQAASGPAAADADFGSTERKFVTILFADIVGSTALVQDLDPEDALDVLGPALTAMRQAVVRFGGTPCKEQGDGVMAMFGAPTADDDHALNACLAALEIVNTLPRLSGSAIHTRAGIHSGEVVARPVSLHYTTVYDATGVAVHIASRLEQLAQPGSVLISAQTHDLVSPHFDFAAGQQHQLRGISQPVDVFEITGRRRTTRWLARISAGLSPFVGRDAELADLRALGERVRTEGSSAALTLVAGPGVGKSRLSHELFGRLRHDGWLTVECESRSIDKTSPYRALRHLISAFLKVDDAAEGEAIRAAIRAGVRPLGHPPAFLFEAFEEILGLPVESSHWRDSEPQFRRRCTIDAVAHLMLGSATRGPTAVLIEDLHWVDDESLAVLDEIGKTRPAVALLLLGTTRPEGKRLWRGSPRAQETNLRGLSHDAVDRMLARLMGEDETLDPLKQRIVDLTGGVPLFLEEVVRRLVESEALAGEPGHYRLAVDPTRIGIPSTVHAVIAARIDRLQPTTKAVLQCAAVLSAGLELPLLQGLAGLGSSDLLDALRTLDEAELLTQGGDSHDLSLAFPHDLVREVAYGALVRDQKRRLHSSALSAIASSCSAAQLEERAELLTHHAAEANDWREVVRFSRLSGGKALDHCAYIDASRFFGQAIDALAHLPWDRATLENSIDLRLQLRTVYSATSRLGEWADMAQEAEATAREIGDEQRRLRSALLRAAVLNFAGSPQESIAVCEDVLRSPASADSQALRVVASYTLGQAHFVAGNLAAAAEVFTPLSESLRGEQELVRLGTPGTTRVMCLSMCAIVHAALGKFAEARTSVAEARQITARTERMYDRAATAYASGVVDLFDGKFASAIAILTDAVALCRDNFISIYLPVATNQLGAALVGASRYDEAARVLEGVALGPNALGQRVTATSAKAFLALARAGQSRFEEAKDLIDQAVKTAQAYGYGNVERIALQAQSSIAQNLASSEPIPQT